MLPFTLSPTPPSPLPLTYLPMPTDTLTAACHGKLPTHGDFVRHRATTPAVRAFDEWVQKGLYQARQQRRSELEAVYDTAPITHFLFNAQDGTSPLLGAMKPSRDRSGRTYPFTVSVEVPPHELDAPYVTYVPAQAHAFFADADRILQAATEGEVDHRSVIEQVQKFNPSFELSAVRPSAYKRYLREETMETLWTRLFGHFGDGRKYRLINNLLDIMLPLRDRDATQLAYGLQFPLGEAEARPNDACFWLEVCFRLLDDPTVEPTFFWAAGATPAARSPYLMLFLQPPQPRAFFQLLAAETTDDNICVLSRMGEQSGAEAALAIPAQYGEMLEAEALRLQDFLDALG